MAGCLNPYLKIIDVEHKYPCILKCGRCEYCRKMNARSWYHRLLFEAGRYNNVFHFVTLTYDSDNIPSDYELKPSHLQGFIKRFRRYLPKGVKIKYFASGEYGSKKGRPHYHLIIFGIPLHCVPILKDAWKFGLIDIQIGRRESLKYVSGYVLKKVGSLSQVRDKYLNRLPPFMRCSHGLGMYFVEKLKHLTNIVRIDGNLVTLPRYIMQKIAKKFNVVDELRLRNIQLLYERSLDFYVRGYNSNHPPLNPFLSKWKNYYLFANKQFERDFLKDFYARYSID